ncbi:G5 domain-containing protein [Agreia pratensis]|uniref:G5 domain-containing protein n=1 Tax=Agreia pratensis TaxID=150121 RepID=A0A1X7JBS3_9MICO|nr:G5 domain-containing protein [Agreia pratensis]SMG25182.1 G5 domain-containing protein [Agreia pratensis]
MAHSRIRSFVFGLALAATVFTTVSCASGSPAGGVAQATDVAEKTSATPTPTPKPVIVVKNVDVAEPIPFGAVSVDDGALDVGQTAISTNGANGTKVTTWAVTTVDGVETGRTVVSSVTSVAPVDQVTSVGTRVPPPPPAPEPEAAPAPGPDNGGCDPNYSGPCVPIASDVDCAGGSGNGPAYVSGPVYVVGSDIYDLDRDGDGIACDK